MEPVEVVRFLEGLGPERLTAFTESVGSSYAVVAAARVPAVRL
jgi:hypothetical protein